MNLPNALTVLRICLVPVFAYLFYHAAPGWGIAVFLLASLTDALDGYLARRWHQLSNFGKLMDPLADKLMTLTMLFCLTDIGRLPSWFLIVLLVKEACLVVASAFLFRKRQIVTPANRFGKIATVLLIVAICLVYPIEAFDGLEKIGDCLIYAAGASSILAALQYAWIYIRRCRIDDAGRTS